MNEKTEAAPQEVAIPVDIYVQCPKKKFIHRPAVKCEGCDFFLGLALSIDGPDVDFANKYTVACNHPISRHLTRIERADD